MAMPALNTPQQVPAAHGFIRSGELRRRYSPRALRRHFRKNIGLRIISLLLAIALWVFVNAGQHSTIQTFNVPLAYRGLPIDFVITNQHPDYVKLQLSGPPTLLSLVDPSRLTLRLDVSGVGVGQASFKIGPDSFNVPRGTSVSSISPSQIILDVDKIIGRNIPLHVVTAGQVADGYRVASLSTDPKTVRIRAPSKELAKIDTVDTDVVDISGISTSTSRQVAVMSPGGIARMVPTEVQANIGVAEVIANKDFRAVPVQVRNTDHQSSVIPGKINLTVRGPKLVLAKLDPKNLAFIDADGLEPGSHDALVQFQLPQGVELRHQWPDKVRIRIKHAVNG